MKTLILFLALMLTTVLANAAGKTVTFNWQDAEVVAVWPACSGSVLVDCIHGFNLYACNGPGCVPTSPSRTKLNPSEVLVPAGSVSTTVYAFSAAGFTKMGTLTAVATVIWVDDSGVVNESNDSLPVTFQIKASAPVSLTAQ